MGSRGPTSKRPQRELARLREEIEQLRVQLEESQETLGAIQSGAVDALVIQTPEGERIFSLEGAEYAYRVLIEQMSEGAVTLNGEGTVQYCNRRFAELLKRPMEMVIGGRLDEWIAEADRPVLAALLAAGTGRKELALRAEGGEVVAVQLSAAGLREGPAGICLVVTDLTERKRHEGRILELNAELEVRVAQRTAQLEAANRDLHAARISAERSREAAEKASKAKDHFLAVLSHELRNPLNPVLASATMLRDDPKFDADTREQLEIICRNAEMEARLIDDLLDVTRIERGKIDLDRRPADLQGIIRRAVEVCVPEIEARRLVFGVEAADGPYYVAADAARLQQVFWNLLKNAVKFTPTGGTVRVRCRRDGEGFVVAEVTDSGVGIEGVALERIFNAFEQAERSIVRQFGGLGLGLTISKALVEMHEGTIQAQSDGIGKGATFTVRLPLLKTPAATSAAPTDAAPRAAMRPLRILLVEDHIDTARIMRRMLAADGHEVVIAGDMGTALRLADERGFDLMLSDLGLPDGSGLELMQALRLKGKDLPGIALSGYGQEMDLQQSREAGFAAHLVKPVNLPKLAEMIASVVSEAARNGAGAGRGQAR